MTRVAPDDADYRRRLRAEADFWDDPPLPTAVLAANRTPRLNRFINESYTGDADVSWLRDVVSRGPFRRAAILGCSGGEIESEWLAARGSRRLDVYDVSAGALDRAARTVAWRVLGVRLPNPRLRVRVADLNFARLPRAAYDVVLSSGSIHHVVNLEHVFGEIAAALRPGGLFALHDYVGERALRYHPQRLARVNEVYRRLPPRFRRAAIEEIAAPVAADASPFEAVRSDDVLEVALEFFEPLHLRRVDALFPLLVFVDFPALEAEDPALAEAVLQAEREARATTDLPGCSVYAVFRPRRR